MVAATSDAVDLSWTAVPQATGYVIYRDGIPLTTTTATEFRDSDVLGGSAPYYLIASVMRDGASPEARSWGLTANVPAQSEDSLEALDAQAASMNALAATYTTSLVQWLSFIPQQYISAPPAGCSYGSAYKFGGDNRTYQAGSAAFRTRLNGTVSWSNGGTVTTSKGVGTTRVYNSSNALVTSATASTANMSVSRLSLSTATSVDLRFVLNASNPFCSVGAIDGAMTITVTRGGSWSISSGNHRQMPNHEINIHNGTSWKAIYRRDYASAACLIGSSACPLASLTGLYGSF